MVSRCLVFVLLPKSLVSSLSIDYLDLIHKNFKKLDMTMTTFSLEQDRNKRLDYVAGVLDGADSSFEVELNEDGVKVLKSIRIQCNIDILNRVEKILGCGSVEKYNIDILNRVEKTLRCGSAEIPISLSRPTFLVTSENEMKRIVKLLNGRIRLNKDFAEACKCLNMEYENPNDTRAKNFSEIEVEKVIKLLTGLIRLDKDFAEACKRLNIGHKKSTDTMLRNLDYKAGVLAGYASVSNNFWASYYLLHD